MYLEISARRTHKTSRLVRELDYHLSSHPDNIVCLTAFKMDHGNYVKRMINPLNVKRVRISTRFQSHIDSFRGSTIVDPLNNPSVMWAWDEFDFMNVKEVPVVQNGYYSTTPKFQRRLKDWANWRNDPLLRLLVANDFMYTAHHGMKAFFDKEDGHFEAAYHNLNIEQFNNEYMSGFDTAEPEPRPRSVRRRNPGDFPPGALNTMLFRG